MTKDELLKLADRCEREGASRELDLRIGAAVGRPAIVGWEHELPAYTTNLDAAVTLVPEGYWYTVNSMKRGHGTAFVGPYDDPMGFGQKERAEASTPALALCAAALRARASTPTQGEG